MSLNHSPAIVTDGLVLCLDAANVRSYPKSGTTWTDLKGSNDGTLVNGPAFTTANRGGIVSDGTNDRVAISLGSLPTPQNSTSFTYEAVVRFDSTSPFRCVVSQDHGTGSGKFLLGLQRASKKPVTFVTGSQIQASNLDEMVAGAVYTLSFGVSGSNIYLGQNGVLELVNTNSFSYTGNGEIRLGTEPGTLGGSHLNGNIYSFRIYNRFLSADELRRNYEATVGRYT